MGGELSMQMLRGGWPGTGKRARAGGYLVERLGRANRSWLSALESEACEFVRETQRRFQDRVVVVAFSGGKDSVVTSHLVRRALGYWPIHVFADTTLEYPDTYDFLSKLTASNGRFPLLVAKPDVDFYELCETIGPPSRVLRWCCSTHKVSPLGRLYSTLNGSRGVLSFGGVRRSESAARARHVRVHEDSKIGREVFACPVIEWSDAEVWAYVLTRRLPISRAYRLGFTRVGCMVCPLNSGWTEAVAEYHYPQVRRWWAFLKAYFLAHGYHDAEERVRSGAWKARAGRTDRTYRQYDLGRSECLSDARATTYELQTGWREAFWEYMKPFGRIRPISDDGVSAERVVVDRTGEPIAAISVVRPRAHVRVTSLAPERADLLRTRVERQLRKYQACVGCGACVAVCRRGAISVSGGYRIDEERCTGCLDCVRLLSRGCPAAHSVSHAEGR